MSDAFEVVADFDEWGVSAFTTTRQAGTYALQSDEAAATVFGRWEALAARLAPQVRRLATAHQVHGDTVLVHEPGWDGWLRASAADAHVSLSRGTALAVTVADCVPVLMAHPSGAVAAVHSGWKGTVLGIAARAVERLRDGGCRPAEMRVHCGPAICGACYEVSPDVHARLTGRTVGRPTPVDLRGLIADQVRALGVRAVSISPWCTRCDNARFFSHRAGDAGRQLGVIASRLH